MEEAGVCTAADGFDLSRAGPAGASWARQLIEREHAKFLGELPAEELLRMLDHEDAEIQQFAAGLLTSAQGLESWPLDTWLRLLETKNPEALATICEVMARNVNPSPAGPWRCVSSRLRILRPSSTRAGVSDNAEHCNR